jgi:hypothetical protein
MHPRMLFAIAATAVLVGGGFVVRPAAPTESLQAVSSAAAPSVERRSDSVSLVTELVTAPTVTSLRAPAAGSRSIVRGTSARAKRSLFARLLLGNGESRPEPFPRPGHAVTGRP